jgi:transposase
VRTTRADSARNGIVERKAPIATIIGIDSHKDLLAGARLDDAGLVEYRPIENTIDGHRQVIDWLEVSGCVKVAIEGSGGYGQPLALTLLDAGVDVVEVPPQMTAAARKGQRSNTKNDKVDATLIGRIGLRDDDLPNPRASGPIEDLRILVG